MAMFSTHNVKQVIVANSIDATGATPGAFVKVLAEPGNTGFYILYTNVSGQTVKSDKISFDKIRSIKALSYVPKTYREDKLTIAAGNVIVGQEYIIRILFRDWGSGSAENQQFKHVGAYKVKTGDTAESIVDAIISLGNANFAREDYPALVFSKEAVTDNLVITEQPQPWVLGKMQARNLNYDIQLVPITKSGETLYEWATIATTHANPGRGNGTAMADLEYFAMGERGDIYRQKGWPYTWDVKYLVDYTKNYNILNIHFFETQEGEGVQAQEKELVVLCKDETGVITGITSAINAVKANTVTPIADAAPTIIVDTDPVAFGNVAEDTTDTAVVNVSGTNLPGDIEIALGGVGYSSDIYTVTKAQAEGTGGKNVTITFAPTAVQAYPGKLLLMSGELALSVNITGAGTGA